MQLAALRYIAVEGPIGVGKTSLARRLADRLGAELQLEAPAENPFLPKFYADPARYALPAQLTFLFQRAGQVKSLAQLNLFRTTVVADFMLAKDPLFAALTLSDDELALYRKLYAHLEPTAPHPDLVILLQASPATLRHRIARRGIVYEQPISEDYLTRLAQAYSERFREYADGPILLVDTESRNFVDDPQQLDALLHHIAEMRGSREVLGPERTLS